MIDDRGDFTQSMEPIDWKTVESPMLLKPVTNTAPNYNITFHNKDGKKVGTMDFNGPQMKFDGDAEESAKIFIDWVAIVFKERFKRE